MSFILAACQLPFQEPQPLTSNLHRSADCAGHVGDSDEVLSGREPLHVVVELRNILDGARLAVSVPGVIQNSLQAAQ